MPPNAIHFHGSTDYGSDGSRGWCRLWREDMLGFHWPEIRTPQVLAEAEKLRRVGAREATH